MDHTPNKGIINPVVYIGEFDAKADDSHSLINARKHTTVDPRQVVESFANGDEPPFNGSTDQAAVAVAIE